VLLYNHFLLTKLMARSKQVAPVRNAAAAAKKSPRKTLVVKEALVRRPRYRPGEKVRREIRHYQKNTALLIRVAPFRRLVRDIGYDFKTDVRFAEGAMLALQEVSEAYLVKLFGDCKLLARHRKASTVSVKDMRLAQRLNPC
jgi:histone H3